MFIFEAVKAGDCEQILKCISQLNHVDEKGNTPLMAAVQKRSVEAVKILVENGADINARNEDGETALYLATKEERIEVITLLLDKGADVDARNAQDGCTALFTIARAGVLPIASLLIQRGANVNLPTKGGNVPLIEAVCYGWNDMVRLLLQHGALVNWGTTECDNTALTWATPKCHYDTVKALLDAGANPWHKTKSGSTPLSMTKDELMKRLIREYQRVDGPCWLVRELSARGLPWEKVCEVQDKLAKEGITSRETLIQLPLAHFTPEHLLKLGVSTGCERQTVLEMRLQSTWLGARLSAMGVSPTGLSTAEAVLINCATEASVLCASGAGGAE